MKKERKNNFIVLKILLCLIRLGELALAICTIGLAECQLR